LATRLGSRRPWFVFWLVGLASPLTIYALDFWEHSIGVALLLWAAVALYDAAEGANARRAAIAGALVGTAFLLRTEALVYGGIGVLVALTVLHRRVRQLATPIRSALAFGAGVLVPVLLGTALELALVGRSLRFTRASTAVSVAGTGSTALPGSRVSDAIATTVNLRPSLDAVSYLGGAAATALIVVLAATSSRPLQPRERRVLVGFAVLVGLLYALRFAEGLGFVPGLFAAAPIAAIAIGLGWSPSPRRLLTAVALGALPFMWLFQFVGGATPQWGGRYELPTTMLLFTVGAVALDAVPRWLARSAVVLSIAVTAFGLLWLSQRSHSIGDAMGQVDRLSQPVLVSSVAHLFREGGASYAPDRRWLTAVQPEQQDQAANLVRQAGYTEFAFITLDAEKPREFDGYRRMGTQSIELFTDVHLRVTTYDASS
jgi:hypothetical protein